jgi:hypothetical protein
MGARSLDGSEAQAYGRELEVAVAAGSGST